MKRQDKTAEMNVNARAISWIIPLAVDAATGRGPPLQIFGTDYPTTDGTCERGFMHVSDLASAHIAAIHQLNDRSESLTLNLGTGRAYSVLDIVSTVERVTGRTVPIIRAPRRSGDPAALVAGASRAELLLGIKPKYSDLETIVETTWRSRT